MVVVPSDNTTEANSVWGTPFYAFNETVEIGDVLYIGCQYRFVSTIINLSTVGVGGVIVWEYYNGSDWTTISVSESVSGADDLNASGKISWSLQNDWEEYEVNSSTNFWIRARVTTAHSTSPKINYVTYGEASVYYDELISKDIIWDASGRIILVNNVLSSGYNKVKTVYSAGTSTVPSVVEQLSTNLAGQKCMVALMGGSFDDITQGRLGDEEFTLGEPYTNLKFTLLELIKEEKELWGQVGVKITFLAS